MSFYQKHGTLIFGTRLKRLSERFLQDISKIYRNLELPFEPTWFGVFFLINERTTVTMTEIANELKITHSAVSQLVNMLKNKELLDFVKADEDKRKILICFTKEGQKLTEKLVPVWQSLKRIMDQILLEGEINKDLLRGLDEIEQKLDERDLLERVLEDMNKYSTKGMKVISYKPEYKKQYRKLMYEYLQINYDDENFDLDIINSPIEKFVSKGGMIFLTKVKDDIVGVAICEIKTKTDANIIYIGVDNDWEWRNIGNTMLREVLEVLTKQKISTVKINLRTEQEDYLNLYQKNGFKILDRNEKEINLELKIKENK